MAKSRARFLAEVLGTTGLVKKSKSALAGADEVIDLTALPSIPNSKLTNSSITINSSPTSLGGSITLTTANVAEGSNLYYTDGRARGAISVSGNAISYNNSTGVLTSNFEEGPVFTSAVTANAGVTVDNITIDGYEIDSNTDLIIDATGDIHLDADGGDIRFKDGGVEFYKIAKNGDHVQLFSTIQDGDLTFNGFDGSSHIVALTLDMSNAGEATFNAGILAPGVSISSTSSSAIYVGGNGGGLYFAGTNNSITGTGNLTLDVAGGITLDADGGQVDFKDAGTLKALIDFTGNNVEIQSRVTDADLVFRGQDGASFITALTLDMSDGGAAHFGNDVRIADNQAVRFGNDQDFRIYSDGSNSYLANSVLNQDLYVQGRDSVGLYNMLMMDMSARKSTFGGIVSSPSGFERGDMFITQNEIDVSSGNLHIDVASSIILDSDAGNVYLRDNSTDVGLLSMANTDLYIRNLVSDRDIIFQGYDGSSNITALTLDMSEAGAATFNSNVTVGGNLIVQGTTTTLNTANLQVEDKNITLNYGTGDTSSSANYAGITIQDAVDSSTNATINWHQSGAFFNFSHSINTDGYLQHVSYLYSRNDLRVLNAASNGWHTWATRNNGTFDLNVGSIQTRGPNSGTSDWANKGITSSVQINAANRTFGGLTMVDHGSGSAHAGLGFRYDGTGYKLELGTASSTSSGISTHFTIDRLGAITTSGHLDVGHDLAVAGTTTITSADSMLLTLNPTAGNYGGILYKYGGVTKGTSIYNSGMMVYGGESSVSTALQAGGQYGLFVHHSTRAVGIGTGTTSPVAKLEIRGSGGGTELSLKTTDASANETFFVQDGGRVGVRYWPLTVGIPSTTTAATNAVFQVEEAGNIFVNSAGSVGFGTTDPLRSLDSRHALNIFGSGGYTELMLRGRAGTAQNLGAWHWSIRGDVGGNNDDLMLLRFTGGTSPSYAGTSMHIRNDNGYVGIGTNTGQPTYPLEVWNSGHSYIRAKSTNANTRAALLTTGEDSSGNEVRGYFGSVGDANEIEVASLTNHKVKLYVNNTPAKGMTIETDGSIVPGARSGGAANLHLGSSAGLSMNSSASGNTLIGYNAGRLVTSATENTALGSYALEDSGSGSGNTAIGRETLMNNQSGAENTAVGKLAMAVNTTGHNNVAVGNEALRLGNASKNTAVGFESGYRASAGEGVFIGYHAGYGVTSGNENTLVGSETMTTTTTATNNTAIGRMALRLNTGNNNTALGHQSMISNGAGEQNTAVGKSSLSSNSSGNYNTAVGLNAGFRNTTGDSNTFIGNTAGYECQSGHSNTAVGKSAFGFGSSTNTANGSKNVAIGMQSLFRITSGYDNSVLGYQAGINVTSGHDNTLIGYGAGDNIFTGTNNTALGADTLSAVNGGSHNVAIGRAAMQSTGGNVTGCVAVGLDTLEGTTGNYNTGIGYRAGNAITTGAKNTIIGAYTGNSGGLDIRSSDNNIVLSDGDGNIRLYTDTSGSTLFGYTAKSGNERFGTKGDRAQIALSNSNYGKYETVFHSVFTGGQAKYIRINMNANIQAGMRIHASGDYSNIDANGSFEKAYTVAANSVSTSLFGGGTASSTVVDIGSTSTRLSMGNLTKPNNTTIYIPVENLHASYTITFCFVITVMGEINGITSIDIINQ